MKRPQTRKEVTGAVRNHRFYHPMLYLQHQVGNAHVARMVAQEDEDLLFAQPEVGVEGGELSPELAARIQAKRGSGSPLDPTKREQMEQAFGTNFDNVRLQIDDEADFLSQSLSAKAFTVGSDIFFYRDTDPNDTHLLAHELTHVAQQQKAETTGQTKLKVGNSTDTAEGEAEETARRVTAGMSVTISDQHDALEQDEESSPGTLAGGQYAQPANEIASPDVINRVVDPFSATLIAGAAWTPAQMAFINAVYGSAAGIGGAATLPGVGGATALGTAPTVAGVAPTIYGAPAVAAETAVAGAGAGAGASLGTMVAAGVGSFLAGFGIGTAADYASGYAAAPIAKALGANEGEVVRDEASLRDRFSLSGLIGGGMENFDETFTKGMRAVGAYDESEPEYQQTVGWNLADTWEGIEESLGLPEWIA